MRSTTRWYVSFAVALLGLSGGSLLTGAAPPDKPDPPKAGEAGAEQIKPRWQPGQKWEVETLSSLVQFGSKPEQQPERKPVLWEFTVLKPEKIGGQDCYRVQVQAKVAGRKQPMTTLWLDQKSLALRQVQTQLPVQGAFRTVTESYQFASGQPSPVMTPLTVIPLDMPVFLDTGKGLTKFTYEAVSGPEGTKAPGDVSFAFEVEQQVGTAAADDVKSLQSKGLLTEDFAKDLTAKPLVEVRLKTYDRKVRQLWQAGLPWPAYSSNGVTQARLVRVIPPPKP